jgi:hypothetical protein
LSEGCGERLCKAIPCESKKDSLLVSRVKCKRRGTYRISEGSSAPTQMTLRRFNFSRKLKFSSEGWAER